MQKMFAGNATKLYDVTFGGPPTLVKSGQRSGNYSAAQLANQGGDWLIVVNDAGDFPLQFNGTTWTTFSTNQISGPVGSAVEHGKNLVYVWKYRNRLVLHRGRQHERLVPAAQCRAGRAADDPAIWRRRRRAATCCLERLGRSTPATASMTSASSAPTRASCLSLAAAIRRRRPTGRQEGRYAVSPPMGMNAHMSIGGDLLIATIDGIIPISQAITKTAEQLDLSAVTRTIKPLWRDEVKAKRSTPWSMKKWDEYGGVFVAMPGDPVGSRHCLAANSSTGAWCRFMGWDATCWMYTQSNLYFGTQDGIVMQADRTGYDDGKPYVATMVGGWEMFQSAAAECVWHQARAAFSAGGSEPFHSANLCLHRLRDRPSATAAGGSRSRRSRRLGPGFMGRGAVGSTVPGAAGGEKYRLGVGRADGVFACADCAGHGGAAGRPVVELISIAATYERIGINV